MAWVWRCEEGVRVLGLERRPLESGGVGEKERDRRERERDAEMTKQEVEGARVIKKRSEARGKTDCGL